MLGRTGTFCAMFTLLEQFKADQVIDVLQTVKLLRIKRPGIVEDLVSSLSCSYAVISYIHVYCNGLTTMFSLLHPGSVPVHIYFCDAFSAII